MSTKLNTTKPFPSKAFAYAILGNTLWVNASEVFRYFVFVMDLMRETFPQLSDIAPMNIGVFLVWGLWDTIIVFGISGFSWLFFEKFGYGVRNAIIAGILFWLTVFVTLWLGLFNMNLATLDILAVVLPLALVEQVIAAIIVNYYLRGKG